MMVEFVKKKWSSIVTSYLVFLNFSFILWIMGAGIISLFPIVIWLADLRWNFALYKFLRVRFLHVFSLFLHLLIISSIAIFYELEECFTMQLIGQCKSLIDYFVIESIIFFFVFQYLLNVPFYPWKDHKGNSRNDGEI